MKSLSRSEDDGILASINVIPFVDIVLVLLVIFMLTSATIMRASIKVDLPRAASAGSKVETTVNLVYTLAGELMVDGVMSSFPAAAQVIRREAAVNPKTQVVISVDKGVPYGQVIQLIDLVRLNGLTSLAFDVERQVPDGASTP